MPSTLPPPEVVRCYFDDGFAPRLPAMSLRWDAEAQREERRWELPEGVTLLGPPPQRFGISIRRRGQDAYYVRLLWDRTCFTWDDVPRTGLLNSALEPLLAAMGTDLWYILDQPVRTGTIEPQWAA
jgi:hypothetical protein